MPLGARDQHARLETLRRDGDRLGDRYGAKTAGIEDVYFSAGGGLGNRARERFAWRICAKSLVLIVSQTLQPIS